MILFMDNFVFAWTMDWWFIRKGNAFLQCISIRVKTSFMLKGEGFTAHTYRTDNINPDQLLNTVYCTPRLLQRMSLQPMHHQQWQWHPQLPMDKASSVSPFSLEHTPFKWAHPTLMHTVDLPLSTMSPALKVYLEYYWCYCAIRSGWLIQYVLTGDNPLHNAWSVAMAMWCTKCAVHCMWL